MGPRTTSPDPGLGVTVELLGGERGCLLDLFGISKALVRKGGSPEEAPPPFLQVQPTGALGDEHLVDPGMRGQPLLNRRTLMTGEVVGDEVEIALRIVLLDRLEQPQVARGVPRRRGHGDLLPIPDPQGSIDPHLLVAPTVLEGGFDAVPIRGPARSRGKGPGNHRAELIEAEGRRAVGWGEVERDDLRPFGTKSGSGLSAQEWVVRQRTPSLSRMRRI